MRARDLAPRVSSAGIPILHGWTDRPGHADSPRRRRRTQHPHIPVENPHALRQLAGTTHHRSVTRAPTPTTTMRSW
jgi:hypothetical protein